MSESGGPASARIAAWLLGEAPRLASDRETVEGLARALAREGCRVARINIGVPLLHPQVWSSRWLWQDGREVVEEHFSLTREDFARFQASPMKSIYEGGPPIRCRLVELRIGPDYPVLDDLRRDGMTDYLALGLPFSDGSAKGITYATDRPGGFAERDLALLHALVPALASTLEIRTLRRTALTLLETYVGREAGRRVLAGMIRRGMGETIGAVIWLSDLRGFAEMSERLARDDLIGMLNDHFGVVCGAVEAEGGEVLKLIGDALLAIFPVAGDPAPACRRALEAARRAEAGMAEVNALRASRGQPPLAYGLALHLGDVMYGNIGGERRLDFTVIGPAVNLASRIGALSGELGRATLLSEDFARASGLPCVPLGAFRLKGLAAPQAVFGLA